MAKREDTTPMPPASDIDKMQEPQNEPEIEPEDAGLSVDDEAQATPEIAVVDETPQPTRFSARESQEVQGATAGGQFDGEVKELLREAVELLRNIDEAIENSQLDKIVEEDSGGLG